MKKKKLTCIDLSTSINSGFSGRFNIAKSSCQFKRTPSLQKAIERIKQQDRISLIGISTISQTKMPNHMSYFQIKEQQHSHRISHPSQEPKIHINQFDQKKEAVRKIFSLGQYCKSQSALQLAAQKYTVKKQKTEPTEVESYIRSTLIDKINYGIMKNDKTAIKKSIKQEVVKRLPKKKKEINYELDTMFQNYEKYSEYCLTANSIPNQPKIYNGYFKIYNQSKHEQLFLDNPGEREKTVSDDSEAYKEFVEEVDEATIQRDVYHSNLRNPFLDDKVTVKTMRKSGLLKRRNTET